MNSRLVETREMKRHFFPDLFCFLPAAAPGSPPDSASHSQQDQDTCSVTSVVSDSATPWTGACQAPLSMGFSRQEYWNGLPFPSLGGLPNPGIKALSPVPPALRAYSLLLSHQGSLGLLQAPSNNLLNHPVLQNQWTFSSCFSLVWG